MPKITTYSLYQCSCGMTFEGSAIREHYTHSFSLRTQIVSTDPSDTEDDTSLAEEDTNPADFMGEAEAFGLLVQREVEQLNADAKADAMIQAYGNDADINYHDDVPEWAQGIRADY